MRRRLRRRSRRPRHGQDVHAGFADRALTGKRRRPDAYHRRHLYAASGRRTQKADRAARPARSGTGRHLPRAVPKAVERARCRPRHTDRRRFTGDRKLRLARNAGALSCASLVAQKRCGKFGRRAVCRVQPLIGRGGRDRFRRLVDPRRRSRFLRCPALPIY